MTHFAFHDRLSYVTGGQQRSPGSDYNYAAGVDIGGIISSRGGIVNSTDLTVRPAMWIDLGN